MIKSVKYRISLLVSSSVLMGVVISFYFVFVNAEFLNIVTPKYLPYTFIIAGISGYFISILYNSFEKNFGAKIASFIFSLLIGLSLIVIWYYYKNLDNKFYLIFFSYTWFWIASNIIILSFWKIPTRVFNLEENKRYNSKISLGEVFSAILVYIVIIPLSRTYNILDISDYILIASVATILFSFIFLFIKEEQSNQEGYNITLPSQKIKLKELFKNDLFKYLFISIIFAMIVQLLVDYSLMNITKVNSSKVGNIATFFSIVYGFMRIIEFTFKVVVANNVVKQYGIFGSFYSMIFTMGLIYIIGLISHMISDSFGLVALILAIAAIGKVMERSINRSMYIPAQNVLFQAYEGIMKNISQSYSSGYGKPLGQLIAGLIMCVFFWITDYHNKITLLFVILIVSAFLWFLNTAKLKKGYNDQLRKRIESMTNTIESNTVDSFKIIAENEIRALFPTDPIEKSSKDYYLKFVQTKNKNEFIHVLNDWEKLLFDIDKSITILEGESTNFEITKSLISLMDKNKIQLENHLVLSLFFYNPVLSKSLNSIFESFSSEQLQKQYNHFERTLSNYKYNLNYIHGIHELKITYYKKLIEEKPAQLILELSKEAPELLFSIIQNLDFKKEKNTQFNIQYTGLLHKNINQFCIILSSLVDLKELDNNQLNRILELELEQTKNAIIATLALKYNKAQIFRIQKLLNSKVKETELIGVEILELILDEDDTNSVSSVFKSLSHKETLKVLESEFPQTQFEIIDRLKAIVFYYNNEMSYITRLTAFNELLTSYSEHLSNSDLKYLCFSSETIIKHLSFKALEATTDKSSDEFITRLDYDWKKHRLTNTIVNILNKNSKEDQENNLQLNQYIPNLYLQANSVVFS